MLDFAKKMLEKLLISAFSSPLKIITLPAPSYNPHQQPFAEKSTHYPRIIARKLR